MTKIGEQIAAMQDYVSSIPTMADAQNTLGLLIALLVAAKGGDTAQLIINYQNLVQRI